MGLLKKSKNYSKWVEYKNLNDADNVKPQIISKDEYLESLDNSHPHSKILKEGTEDEEPIIQLVVEPRRIVCPDCGGITLEGLEMCDKCGGELDINI